MLIPTIETLIFLHETIGRKRYKLSARCWVIENSKFRLDIILN